MNGYALIGVSFAHVLHTRLHMASFQKHNSGWRVFVLAHGKRHSKVFPTKKEAQAWALEIESSLRTKAKGWHSFREAALKYIKEVSPTKRSPDWEERRIQTFIEHFGDKRLGELDTPDIAGWRDARLRSVSGSTVNREKNLLCHIFTVARTEWKWMEQDLFDGVKMPKENPPRHQRWTWQLIKRMLRAGQRTGGKTQEVTEAFHISLRTGMRLNEALAAPALLDRKRRVLRMQTKTRVEEIPVGRLAFKLVDRPPFTVGANEASTLFSQLRKSQLIEGLTLRDARATALTLLAKKVDILTLARISRHKDMELLRSTYYRETAEEIARRI